MPKRLRIFQSTRPDSIPSDRKIPNDGIDSALVDDYSNTVMDTVARRTLDGISLQNQATIILLMIDFYTVFNSSQ